MNLEFQQELLIWRRLIKKKKKLHETNLTHSNVPVNKQEYWINFTASACIINLNLIATVHSKPLSFLSRQFFFVIHVIFPDTTRTWKFYLVHFNEDLALILLHIPSSSATPPSLSLSLSLSLPPSLSLTLFTRDPRPSCATNKMVCGRKPFRLFFFFFLAIAIMVHYCQGRELDQNSVL